MHRISFGVILQAEPLDLSLAALVVARDLAYPGLDIRAYLQELNYLALRAQQTVRSNDRMEAGRQLAHFLYVDQEWQGNREQYSDPRNSYFNDVLDRRLGIPVTLAVLYLDLARRLEIPASGIGLPGHFILAVRQSEEKLLLDPFDGGRELTIEDCAQLVKSTIGYEGLFQPEWLKDTPPRTILARLLNNLALLHVREANWPTAIKAMEYLRLTQPNVHGHLRDLAFVYYQSGSLPRAAQLIEQYAELAPDAPDIPFIRQNAELIMASWAKLN